ncbi:aminoglycoside phosphotransferase, partial [Exophiala aquamarina CBS 119918]
DRVTLVYRDYKIDNLLYHNAQPRVIGVLYREMVTIGHPPSDVINLVSPGSSIDEVGQVARIEAGMPNALLLNVTLGLPTLDQAL